MVNKPLNKFKMLFAFLIIVALLVGVTACSSDDKKSSGSESEIKNDKPESLDLAQKGGTLTIGAEQEPDCLDFVGSCSGASWGFWTVAVNTLPRAYSAERVGDKNEWETKITNLLASEPVLETEPVQKITYQINPKAVWSDGVAITGADFVYTWDQIANGEDVYDRSGYQDIESVEVDPADDHKVVVTMAKVYAGWKDLFGGNYGVLPSHILEGKDRAAEMTDGYTFSGGPFKLEAWNKGESIVLVPNENYWGDKPVLDKVIFALQTDTVAEFKSFNAGEVSAIYPQPQIDVVESINSGLKDAKRIVNKDTASIEAIWINNEAAPFDSLKVRQSFAYSIDRDAIVNALFGDIGVKEAANSFLPEVLKEYADEVGFSGYKLDAKKAAKLLEEDGWSKGSDGIYAKDGKQLEFTLNSTEGNERRKLMMENIQKQLEDAGWKVTIAPVPAGDLFGDLGPSGNFQAAIYAQVLTVLNPTNCNLFCLAQIPSEENDNSGQNWTRTRNDEADVQLQLVDSELDVDNRIKASKAAEKILAEEATSFPLDPLPNILIWKSNVVGEIDENPIQGPFWTLNKWGLKK